MIPDQDNQGDETGDKRLQAAKHKESPKGMDMILQKLIDPTIVPDPLNIPESLANSKRPRNKRKNKKTKESSKPQYHPPRQDPIEPSRDQSQEEVFMAEPSNKRQKKEKEKSPKQ